MAKLAFKRSLDYASETQTSQIPGNLSGLKLVDWWKFYSATGQRVFYLSFYHLISEIQEASNKCLWKGEREGKERKGRVLFGRLSKDCSG